MATNTTASTKTRNRWHQDPNLAMLHHVTNQHVLVHCADVGYYIIPPGQPLTLQMLKEDVRDYTRRFKLATPSDLKRHNINEC